MNINKTIDFLGYTWTMKEFAGIYLLESFSTEQGMKLEEFAPYETMKEVIVKFMGEERFNNLISNEYIEPIEESNGYKPTSKFYFHSNEFLSCIIKWLSIVENEMSNPLNNISQN